MPIIEMQRRLREVGRIRLGIQAVSSTGKRAPRKLQTFRFTSPDKAVVEAAAARYGGEVKPWDNDGRAEWEVISKADVINVALQPHGLGFTQWYEAWAKGYCVHRCDGSWDHHKDQPCSCNPEARECNTTTRLSVLLPDVPGMGVWRVESHGWYAGTELLGTTELLKEAGVGHMIVPARLRLEPRTVKRLVKGKPETYRYAVPVIDLSVTFGQLAAGQIGGALEPAPTEAPAMAAATAPELPPAGWKPVPGDEAVGAGFVSVEAQLQELERPKQRPPRKNAAKPIEQRTAPPGMGPPAQTCTVCGEPYGADEGLVPNPNKGREHSRFVHARHLDEPAEPAEVAASQGSQDGGSGGTSDGERSTVEPARPTVVPLTKHMATEAMSNLQRGKLHAMAAELWPQGPDETPGEWNERKHDQTLALCEALGAPGLQSRADIDRGLAAKVIDALDALKAGDAALTRTEDGDWRLEDTIVEPDE